MKKLLALIVVFFALIQNVQTNSFSLLDYFDGEMTYYTSSSLVDGRDLGFCYMGDKKSGKIIGESCVIKDGEVNSIIASLKAETIKTEYIDDEIIVYAFSTLIPACVYLFNQKVNIQIAIKDERCVIGWPLILGEF